MNRNNLSWVDNKVLNPSTQNRPSQTAPQMRPYMDTMPAQYQDMPASPAPTGVSPSTYQAPMTGMPNQSGVSPSTYQAPMSNMPNQMGLSPATYQEPAAKAPEQTGLSPATYQAPPSKNSGHTGLSPATYQTDPSMDLGMMGVPRPSVQAPGTQGTLTRTEAQDASPFMEGPPTIMSAGYTPAYLKTIIGRRVRAEFVFQNLYLDKTGILREVGISYFVLEDSATHAMVMCDLYSVRFITSV